MNAPTTASIIIDKDYAFFSPLNLLATFLGLVILYLFAYVKRRKNRELDYYKYYIPAFSFKVLFVTANTIFYIVAYQGGGDSIAFWDGAVKLNNLFWNDPYGYFEEIFRNDDLRSVYKNFNLTTGYPDTSIYYENESFFICKIASFFTFLTFKGYILMSVIFAFVTTNATWRVFELVRSYKLHSDWHLALAIFFIPSLSFWCGGISKDTIVLVAVFYFLHHLFKILSLDEKSSWINWFGILLSLYVLLQVRSFMIITICAPLLFAYTARMSLKFKTRAFERNFIKLSLSIIGVALIFGFFQTPEANKYVEEAAVISQDMSTNKIYGSNKYSLGITDYSGSGMIVAIPVSIMAGIYRPYLWEALSVSLILNGIESIGLMFFTIRFFFNRHIFERIRRIRKHEFLIFALFFGLILAYFAGFTSILFGVLVRFKAPVLPFLMLVLTAHHIAEKNKKEIST